MVRAPRAALSSSALAALMSWGGAYRRRRDEEAGPRRLFLFRTFGVFHAPACPASVLAVHRGQVPTLAGLAFPAFLTDFSSTFLPSVFLH